MKEILVRKAVLEDMPTLLNFEQGIILAERPYDPTLSPGHINYYDIGAMIESHDAEVIVAVCDQEVIGSAYIKIRQAKPYLAHSHYGYLGFMYVKPTFRGLGVNKLIIDELKNWAIIKGVKELRLNVYAENESAIRAYEKTGFEKHLINMRIEI